MDRSQRIPRSVRHQPHLPGPSHKLITSFVMFRSSRTFFALASLALLHYSAAAADFHCDLAQPEPFLDQANRFILAGLQYQPVEATQSGYHGDANVLDNELDDFSPETIAAQRKLMLAGKI